MIVIPAIDLMAGKCVQLVGGKPGTEQVVLDNPAEIALKWQDEGAERLHVIDLDRVLGEGDNTAEISKIIEDVDIPVQVGGGIRDETRVENLFSIGVENVIVGTRAIKDKEWLEYIADRYPKRVIVAVDAKNDKILIKGWQESSGKQMVDYVKGLKELKLAGILYTNVGMEGKLSGIEIAPIKKILSNTSIPLIVSGGITTLDDLKSLNKLNIYACVIGLSLYKGKIELREAIKLSKRKVR
jgi:phosphoribosylformimino-5-aminoimidazole carboxamide ribotide isomerase